MHEIGVIKSIDGIFARVLIGRKSSCCESCEKESCDIPEDGVETEAINEIKAKVGQKVKVVMKSHTYIKGALVLYALPIFAFISGAVLGEMHLSNLIRGIDPELLAALVGFCALFTSLIIVKLMTNRMEKKTENRSVIESIVE
jgi:positive regulator of sigma E activity